ncbi:aspartate ammonia-lyase [Bacteroidota bacterium]
MRTEKDSLGEIILPEDVLYGIHSLRSVMNFIKSGEVIDPYFIKAFLQVKKAAAITNFNIGLLVKEKFVYIEKSIDLLLAEIDKTIEGKSNSIYTKIIIDPYQGGAGTSMNMNINEVITNTALKLMGKDIGDYETIHPLDHVNMSQSTNDTYPTALKIASIVLLRELQNSCAVLQNSLQEKENEFKNILKLGRTQFQDAVPITLGQEFGAYSQAISRDRWRLYNAEERLRSVNLGGTAVGNSITANKDYLLNVNTILKKITGLPIAKGEDLIDVTQNLDVFVEVHGIVKSNAVSVLKICNDLRILSSGPIEGIGEIILPAVQAGSSIMPGKVNPVILENSIQVCELIKGNDQIISNVVSSGNLELNAFIPLLAHLFLKSVKMLRDSNLNLSQKCIIDISADTNRCKQNLLNSSAIAAALIPRYGYETIQKVLKDANEQNISFVKALIMNKILSETELDSILSKEIGLDLE